MESDTEPTRHSCEPALAQPEGSCRGPAEEHGKAVIIGAGPAGLTAAYQLAKARRTSTVLEADSVVGGISTTTERDGWRFDMGGHRFFTKVPAVENLWHEILRDGDLAGATLTASGRVERGVLALGAAGMAGYANLAFLNA